MTFNKSKSPVKNCIEFIEQSKKGYVRGDNPYIEGEKEVGFEISDKSMFNIPECEDWRRLGYVDGGTGIVIRSSDFNINFTRIAGVKFEKNQVVSLKAIPDVIEFYSATISESLSDGNLAYTTKLFPLEPEYVDFLPDLEITIPASEARMPGGFLPNIELFGGVIMRFAEWSYGAKFVENELSEGDMYVRDGSLQTGFKDEILLTRELFSTAVAKKVCVTGLSKSCRLITKNGDSLITLVNIIGSKKFPEKQWYYHPIYQITKADNQADVHFVKLHNLSVYPFRFDVYIEQSKLLSNKQKDVIMSNLAANSNDLSFPGYPFGLLKVDQMARVGAAEIKSLKLQFLSKFNSEHYEQYIKPRLHSVDAHDLLNILRK